MRSDYLSDSDLSENYNSLIYDQEKSDIDNESYFMNDNSFTRYLNVFKAPRELDDVRRILTPLSKDQLIELLASACVNNQCVLQNVLCVICESRSHRRLYIKNLPFSACTESVIELFSKFGEVEEGIVLKKDGKSRGYAFITFKTIESALLACKSQINMNGRALMVKLAADPFPFETKKSDAIRRKLFVRNLGFETNEESLKSVFSKYGELEESVILRTKKGESKGYGFITFENTESTVKALQQPHHIIDGRLVFVHQAVEGKLRHKNGKDSNSSNGNNNMSSTNNTGNQVKVSNKKLNSQFENKELKIGFSTTNSNVNATINSPDIGGIMKKPSLVCDEFITDPKVSSRGVNRIVGGTAGTNVSNISLAQRSMDKHFWNPHIKGNNIVNNGINSTPQLELVSTIGSTTQNISCSSISFDKISGFSTTNDGNRGGSDIDVEFSSFLEFNQLGNGNVSNSKNSVSRKTNNRIDIYPNRTTLLDTCSRPSNSCFIKGETCIDVIDVTDRGDSSHRVTGIDMKLSDTNSEATNRVSISSPGCYIGLSAGIEPISSSGMLISESNLDNHKNGCQDNNIVFNLEKGDITNFQRNGRLLKTNCRKIEANSLPIHGIKSNNNNKFESSGNVIDNNSTKSCSICYDEERSGVIGHFSVCNKTKGEIGAYPFANDSSLHVDLANNKYDKNNNNDNRMYTISLNSINNSCVDNSSNSHPLPSSSWSNEANFSASQYFLNLQVNNPTELSSMSSSNYWAVGNKSAVKNSNNPIKSQKWTL